MKLQTQRLIDRWLGQVLCAVVSAWVRWTGRVRQPAVMAQDARHILVILLSEMGSIVLAGPMFAALRQRYTIIVITHRHAWTVIADRLFEVKDGRVHPVTGGSGHATSA